MTRRSLGLLLGDLIEVALAFFLATGSVGLVLAMIGTFQPLIVLGSGSILAWVVVAAWKRTARAVVAPEPLWAGLALIAVILWTALNFPFTSEEIWTGRDGGTYYQTALRIVDTGALLSEPADHPLLPDDASRVGPGFALDSLDRIVPQFLHVVPVLGAATFGLLGPSGLQTLNLLVGASALLAFYYVAQKRVGGPLGLLVMLALATSLPFIHFSRGIYTEIMMMLFLLGAVYVTDQMPASRTASRGSFFVGALCGAAILTRIDALLLLLPIGFFVGWGSGRIANVEKRWLIRGFIALASLAVIDLAIFSRYYLGIQANRLLQIALGSVCAVVLGRILWAWKGHLTNALRSRPDLAIAAGVAVVLIVSGALAVRAACCPTYGEVPNSWVSSAQENDGVAIEPTRTYEESAPLWLGWYVGWPTVALALGGAVVVIRRLVKGDHHNWLVLLAVTGPFLLYLIQPSITPDHIWAARRLVPTIIPLALLLAAVALREIERSLRFRPVAIAAAPILLIGSLVTVPLATHREWGGAGAITAEICRLVDDRPVLVVDAEGGLARQQLLMPLNSVCDVAVGFYTLEQAKAQPLPPGLVIVTLQESVIEGLDVSDVEAVHGDIPVLERTVIRVPTEIEIYKPTVFIGVTS